MSLASLVTVSSTHFRNHPSSCDGKAVSGFHESSGGRFRARIAGGVVTQSPRGVVIVNAATLPVFPNSSLLRVSSIGRGDWSDARRGCKGFGGYGGRLKESGQQQQKKKYKQTQTQTRRHVALHARASSVQETVSWIMEGVKWGWTASPPTWEASFISLGTIFVVAAPALFVGLTKTGIVSAYLLGSLIWRAYGGQGLLTIICFYILGTAATKLKLKEKQKEGIAEKRSGRRGPASVLGSGAAGAICAICSIYEVGGFEFAPLWQLGYLASLCTKLSDTISSEIGKAYGKTTYLVTTFSVVPRGTEGAVSLEGTLAGVISAVFLAGAAYALQQVDLSGAIIVVVASQLANLFESYVGATLQGRPGYEWMTNDVVNVFNITVGATLAILAKKLLG